MQWAETRERPRPRGARAAPPAPLQRGGCGGFVSEAARRCIGLFTAQETARKRLTELDAERREARSAFDAARDAERPAELLAKREDELRQLALSNPTAPR